MQALLQHLQLLWGIQVDAVQVLRADLIAQDPLGRLNIQEPRRSLLKPEMVWQYEKGFQQSPEQVCRMLNQHVIPLAFLVDCLSVVT